MHELQSTASSITFKKTGTHGNGIDSIYLTSGKFNPRVKVRQRLPGALIIRSSFHYIIGATSFEGMERDSVGSETYFNEDSET